MKRLLKKWCPDPSLWICALLISPMPMGVMVPAGSVDAPGGVTTVQFGAGSGSYRRELLVYGGISGCNGEEIWIPINFDSDFIDAGGEIDHQYSDRGHVGIRGGYVRENATLGTSVWGSVNTDSIGRTIDPAETYFYLNPFISFEGEYLGAGIGVIISDGSLKTGSTDEYPANQNRLPSLHLRVGKRSVFYASASFGESVPIYSGGAMFRAGIGIQPVSYFDAWGGIGKGPWPGRSYLLSVGVHPQPNWSINTNMRFRSPDDEYRELGLSVGLTYRFGM